MNLFYQKGTYTRELVNEIRAKMEELMNKGYEPAIWVDGLYNWSSPEKIDAFFEYMVWGVEQSKDPANVHTVKEKINSIIDMRNRVVRKYKKERQRLA